MSARIKKVFVHSIAATAEVVEKVHGKLLVKFPDNSHAWMFNHEVWEFN